MPTYDYKCENCDHMFEYFQAMSDLPLKKCPECECVWELHLQTKTILTYADFPAYGLKKEICKKCKTTD